MLREAPSLIVTTCSITRLKTGKKISNTKACVLHSLLLQLNATKYASNNVVYAATSKPMYVHSSARWRPVVIILARWALFCPTHTDTFFAGTIYRSSDVSFRGETFFQLFPAPWTVYQLNRMHLPRIFHSIWHFFWRWKFSALHGDHIPSDSCCPGRPTMRWPTCTQTRRPTPSATARSPSMASLASSSATPWPTPMPWCCGRVSSATLPTPPSASLTSSSRAGSRSGWDSLVLWCCCPTEWREWALNTVLPGNISSIKMNLKIRSEGPLWWCLEM